ncbi:MAG: hypothetical protein JOZ27_07060 [Caulobacteraceae bacterium]|nr:hypothetical protein [Caulobacteraceae bacterium]
MMPVVRISDRNWDRLKKFARPLEDSADDVVGRALDALEARGGEVPSTTTKAAPRKRGNKLPQKDFREPLLGVLRGLGGMANVATIREKMLVEMGPKLLPGDHQLVSSGDPRWWNAVCWVRNDLANEGVIDRETPRGVWALAKRTVSEKGDSRARRRP